MTKKKIYTLNTAKGICMATGNADGLSYAKNMIGSSGVAKKRNGWRVIYNFRGYSYQPQRINGIYEFKSRGKDCLIVHADTQLYECSHDFKSVKKIPLENGVVLKNQRSEGTLFSSLLWLGGMGQLLVYDGEVVSAVKESSLAYVPVTSTEIKDVELGEEYTRPEAPSLITNKRINYLRGVKNSSGTHRFLLDTKACYGKPFVASVSFRVKKSADEEDNYTTSYVGFDESGQERNTVVTLSFCTEALTEHEIFPNSAPVDLSGREIRIDGVSFNCRVLNGNELYFNFDALAHQRDADNICVQFSSCDGTEGELDGVEAMTVTASKEGGSLMALSTGTSRLYFNYLREGRFYFPADGIVTVGAEVDKITSVLPMAQSALAVYKRGGFFVLIPKDEKSYEVFPGSGTQGSLNPYVARRLGADCLVLSEDGIYGVTDTEGKNYINTRLHKRSFPIQEELDKINKESLENACACVHKEDFYLFEIKLAQNQFPNRF